MVLLLFVMVALSVLLMSYSLLFYVLVERRPSLRVKKYLNFEGIRKSKESFAKKKGYRAGLEAMSKQIAGLKLLDGYKLKISKQLVKGHVLLKPEEYISIKIILFSSCGLIGLALKGVNLIMLVFALAGLLLPDIVLKIRIQKRVKTLNDQLGDAISLISNSLKAGYSFFQSVEAVSHEMSGPISEEFSQLQKEVSLGVPTEQALENLADRAGSEDLDMVVTAVLIQRQTGGNLSVILDSISSTIRQRVKVKGDIKTLTAQGRASGIIISVLPVALGTILYIINPEHIGLLFKDEMGIMLLLFSGIMEFIGIMFIRKIIKIEF